MTQRLRRFGISSHIQQDAVELIRLGCLNRFFQ